MRVIWTIAKKEFKGFFTTPVAFVVLGLFLGVMGWMFFTVDAFFDVGLLQMRSFFGWLPLILLFFIPALTMRVWAEERKMGTHEWLMTMPVRDFDAVAGKFLGCYLLYALMIFLTLPLPILLSTLGEPDWGPIWGGYAASLLMGGAYIAIGQFCSSLTKNQVLAFLTAVLISFSLWLLSRSEFLNIVPANSQIIIEKLGMSSHFESVERGVIDSRDIVYYLSLIFFFLYLNMKSLDGRNW